MLSLQYAWYVATVIIYHSPHQLGKFCLHISLSYKVYVIDELLKRGWRKMSFLSPSYLGNYSYP